jgi:hypothetical protein
MWRAEGMKKLIVFLLLAACSGICSGSFAGSNFKSTDPDTLVKKDSMNLAILVVDFTTYKFEKGTVVYYPICRDCDRDSLPFKIDYKQPGDFGEIKFSYTETGQTLFYATIIWDGTGSIIYPAEFIKADQFGYQDQPVEKPEKAQYFDRTLTPYIYSVEKYRAMADSAWQSVDSLEIVREFTSGAMRVGFYAWPPSVGMFCPTCAKWIIFLYSGNDFNLNVPVFSTIREVSVYPVPARDELFIEMDQSFTEKTIIRIFNSAGILVHLQEAFQDNISRIDLSGFDNGLYYVDVRNRDGQTNRKIMVFRD